MSRQKLGQHFLIRKSILERIAAVACPHRVPLVIEIGPGKGALTEHLLLRADRVIAVELDSELAERLKAKFPAVEIVSGDVLDTDLNQWGPGVVAGNLPYYVSTAILSKVLAPGSLLHRGVFLVQKEVAERVTAKPGTRAFGYLSVESQLLADVRMLFPVHPSAFHPPPKVDSAVLGYALHSRAQELGIDSVQDFLKFVRQCFVHKRKTIRNNLGAQIVGEFPEASFRAEQLSVEQFAGLYQRFTSSVRNG